MVAILPPTLVSGIIEPLQVTGPLVTIATGADYNIFCNLGVPGRTGHDYQNYWEGEKLVWHGKNGSHFGQQSKRSIISGDYQVRMFYRESDRAPFT